ncbi:MAG: bifunctional phosphoglucose/phosphomannose isomerase [Parcubacteria group bacterium]|jgi:glucose/mannose-6-phosphate isomerase
MQKNNPLDRENLRQVILDSPQQFAAGLELAKNIKIEGDFKLIEISGMGGSSLPANILRIYLNSLYLKNPKKNKALGIFQNRSYSLPHEAYKNCLNFFASYSGNTEETIFSLKEAIKHKLPSIGFGTGGKLVELCQKNNIPCVILPAGIQPRYATGYFFAAMFQVLVNCGLIEDMGRELVQLAKKLEKDAKKLEAQGKKIAQKLVGKTPIIYSTPKYKSLAMIWKIKINENAKTPAFYNFYPELNHNEMVGFTLPQGKFHVITLINQDTHPQNIKRMRITAKLLKKNGIDTTFIEMENSNVFHTIFSTLLLGDWISYYLALAYKQDPTPVVMVEDLKKQLA